MAKYLIAFPSSAMVVPDGEWDAVVRDSHAVIEDAKAAGVHVFAGGIDDTTPVLRVSADGRAVDGASNGARDIDGGFAIFELPTREVAIDWAARLAKACRADQELRVFHFDPAS